jgi:NAD(P)-dependent dehydrogenase (short-subunit alcohol dehydrogenase family)
VRVALVSGGNRGIGFAICRALAELGMQVALGSRDLAAGTAAVTELEPGLRERVLPVQLDVTDDDSVRAAVARVQQVDVLVNNAGVYLDESESAVAVPIETVETTLDTNLVGALRLCQAVIPGMRKRRYGRIVNVSSGYGNCDAMDSGGVLAYKLSKLGLNAMTRVLAAELKGTGVLVNAMDPGWVRTRMGGRGARRTPEEAAATAIYLASLPANGATGSLFHDKRRIAW